jgi:hypothetical protein
MATKKAKLKKATAKAPTGTATANPQAPAGAPAPDPSALSIGDLKNLSQILDVASTRGAFKAGEMAQVGFLYNKLQAFLAKVSPPEKPGIAEAPTGSAPTQPAPVSTKGA